MRVLLDACILYPTILREILIATAARGDFTPLWSDRILEEWIRAAARTDVEATARIEIALLRADWPTAVQDVAELPETVVLPDLDDHHVLGAALAGGAEVLLTRNLKDFPTRLLSPLGVHPRGPDEFLLELHHAQTLIPIVEAVRLRTEHISGRDQPVRPLLKRAGLPRLAKALRD